LEFAFMTINGRLLLLVVVTGLFVRVWTTNDRARARCKSPARSHVTYRMPPPDPVPRAAATPGPAKEVAVRPVAAAIKSAASLEKTWNASTCPIPLPAGIGSGIYRVVDDTGSVARLEIELALALDQNFSAAAVAPDFLMTTSGSSRWYFIRLRAAVEPLLVVQSPDLPVEDSAPNLVDSFATGNERLPCTNRKFDFTGYVTPNGTATPEVDELARPEPPDLPVSR
jgi:hypothetical protein